MSQQDPCEKHFEMCVNNMKNAIKNNPDIHQWILSFKPEKDKGFMWTQHKYINNISNTVSDDGHSGCSFALCLRNAQRELVEEKNNNS